MRIADRSLKLVLVPMLATVTLDANAGPPDGAVVVLDHPDGPDVIIQDLREENFDATHAPVRIRVGVPTDADGGKLKSARITAWLTSSSSNPDAPQLSEASVTLGPRWANRSVVVEVPSPGEGEYFVHVRGVLRLADQDPINIEATSTQTIRFGKSNACQDIAAVPIADMSACPLLFDTGTVDVLGGSHGAANKRLLDEISTRLDELCTAGSLHRVSVRGWASTRHSVNPTNEELAEARAKSVTEAILSRVSKTCQAKIHNDSVKGTLAVTTQFGDEDANQCAQLTITRHSCQNPSTP